MSQQDPTPRFPTVGDGSGLEHEDKFYREEVQLAFRNRGMPLEALRYPITPTGMHYLLTHFDVPDADPHAWRLTLGGLVSHPLSLSLEDVKARPSQTTAVTMECAGNGRALLTPRAPTQPWLLEAIGTSEWTGISLKDLLAEAGIDPGAVEILFTGLDQGVQGDQVQFYQRSLSVAEATRPEVLLAFEMNGQPLEPQHGFPLRLIVPGWYGMTSVKWLDRIEAVAEHFQGYQMDETYRYVQSPDQAGDPVDLIKVRALMAPPGIPDFLTRIRLVKAGLVFISGRAWAGRLGIAKVEVSGDGAATWSEADLGEGSPPYAWRAWSWRWTATPGRHTLCVRATDQQGNVQPVEQPWNYQGMGNNMVQRVQVLVE